MQEDETPSRQERGLFLALRRRMDHLVRSLCTRWRGRLESEMVEDYSQEAACWLWQRFPKLKAWPAEERERYVDTCARRLVWRLLQRELEHTTRSVAFEELSLREKQQVEAGRATFIVEEQFFAKHWQENASSPALDEALHHLSARDSVLMDLFCAQGLTDPEIATRMNLSLSAVKQQRNRILIRMRHSLGADIWPDGSIHPAKSFFENLSPGCHLS